MSSGKLYYEIPQISSPKCTEERLHFPEDPLEYVAPGIEQSKSQSFITRSNSLSQEDTIVEVEEPSKICSADVHVEGNNVLPEKTEEENKQTNQEIAVVEVHIPPPDEINVKPEEEKRIIENERTREESFSTKSEIIVDETIIATKITQPSYKASSCDLQMIEESSELNEQDCSAGECKSNENLTELELFEKSERLLETMVSTLDSVDNNVNDESSEGQSNIEEEREMLCENILEQTETEVMFDLPDYVNITVQPLPPVPPRSQYSHITL